MENNNKDYRLYIAGGLLGAAVGVLAAFIIEKTSEAEGGEINISRQKLTKVGLGIISMLWGLIDQGRGRKGRK